MSKKFLIFLLITAVGFFGSFYVVSKLQARKLRQKQYEEAKNKKAEEINLTILEGWHNNEIADYLEKQGVVKSGDFKLALENFSISDYEFLPAKAQGNLQGFLYPDTYRFFKSITDRTLTTPKEAGEVVIKKMLQNFGNKLPKDAEILAQQHQLSLYEAMILASIVEKEANNFPNEKATIAGIFLNRLKIGMPLQSDATVNYATGKSEASPSLVDLEIDSPYNTYKHKGLPPTPISNPSVKSIEAILNPADTEYLYYLHDQKTGQPYYAKTHEEHVQNKFKYLK